MSETTDSKPFAPRLDMRRGLFALAALMLAAAPGVWASAQGSSRQRIVTASGVRVRSEPDTAAAEAGRLQLGMIVEEVERSAAKSKVGASEDYWYMVSAPGGARGWVFGALTAPFEASKREETYRRIADSRVNNTDATFAELSDLVRFLDRATKEVKRKETLAELELARFVALGRSLAALPFEEMSKEPYKQWTDEHDSEIVYSEPAGQWYVRSDKLWELREKYKDLPAADRIAWEAAQTPLPGECEGYLPCHLGSETMTHGRYLKLHPRGAHVPAAMANIAQLLDQISDDLRGDNPVYDVPAEDRAEFRKTIETLRDQLSSVASPRKARVLDQLGEIERRFR